MILENGHSQDQGPGRTPENAAGRPSQRAGLTPENAELLAEYAGHLERFGTIYGLIGGRRQAGPGRPRRRRGRAHIGRRAASQRWRRIRSLTASSGHGSGRRREELEGDSVRVAEGDPGAVMGVLDSAVRDAELVQARGPGLQLIAVAAGERNMIQAGAVLVESVTCGLGVGMQAEQLPSAEREHGVVKAPGLLVLV